VVCLKFFSHADILVSLRNRLIKSATESSIVN